MSGQQTFWARRKAKVEAEAQADLKAVEARNLSEEQAELDELSDDALLENLELPNPDEMKMGDDFSGFMSKSVPDRLRRRALRTLWRSNPVLANVDNLVDYGEDFTDAALAVENIQTANKELLISQEYQKGRGLMIGLIFVLLGLFLIFYDYLI